jgi:cyanophycinase
MPPPIPRRHFNQAMLPLMWLTTQVVAEESKVKEPSESGPLLYGGGKPQTASVQDQFWKMAGGKKARIVVVPTAHEHMDSPETALARIRLLTTPWEERGVASLHSLHTLQRAAADDPHFMAHLEDATGIWFGGGDQRRLLETYRDTKFHERLIEFSKQGGVIGGSSAGTAVQSEWAITSNDRGEVEIARGLNLWPGTIIDQHFLARRRQARLRTAIEQKPHLIGIGIDEFTALVAEGEVVKVFGDSIVNIYRYDKEQQKVQEFSLLPGKLYNRAFVELS